MKSDTEIKGDPLFYTTSQVSEMLNEAPSCIRFWSERFNSLLDIEVSNRNKQYKKADIDKLKFIQKLIRKDKFTLQQVENYCSSKGFDKTAIGKAVIDTDNPLTVQIFTQAVMTEMNKRIEESMNQMKEFQSQMLKQQEENNKKLEDRLVNRIDAIISEKLNDHIKQLKTMFDERELHERQRDTEMIDKLKESMNNNKKENKCESKSIEIIINKKSSKIGKGTFLI